MTGTDVEVRFVLTNSAIRQACIDHNWFTHGCNDDYQRMFDRADDENGFPNYNRTAQDILDVAQDVLDYSSMATIGGQMQDAGETDPLKYVSGVLLCSAYSNGAVFV